MHDNYKLLKTSENYEKFCELEKSPYIISLLSNALSWNLRFFHTPMTSRTIYTTLYSPLFITALRLLLYIFSYQLSLSFHLNCVISSVSL